MNKGAIRNPDAYLAAALRRPTELLDECFPRGITFGDIDSMVEINRHFLFIEWKVGNQEIPTGQWVALHRLASQPRVTVWAVWTDENREVTHGLDLSRRSAQRGPITLDGLRAAIRAWVASSEAAND